MASGTLLVTLLRARPTIAVHPPEPSCTGIPPVVATDIPHLPAMYHTGCSAILSRAQPL